MEPFYVDNAVARMPKIDDNSVVKTDAAISESDPQWKELRSA